VQKERSHAGWSRRAGTYSVTITDDYGCRESRSCTLNQPAQPIVINGVVTDGNGTLDRVDITVTGGVLPYRLLWSNNATSEDINELLPGNYTATVTDANLCVATSTFTVKVSTGIDKTTLNKAVKLYPNPAMDKVKLEVDGLIPDKVTIIGTDGKIIWQTKPAEHNLEIDTRAFAPGLYKVAVHSGSIVTVMNLIIQR